MLSVPPDVDSQGGAGSIRMVFAYVLMTYRNPNLIVRLVEKIRESSPQSLIVVRHDNRAHPLTERARLQAAGAVIHEYSERIDWGRWSMVAAQLTQLRWIRDHSDVEYVVFVTGQDYLLKPLGPWEAEIRASGADFTGNLTAVQFHPRWFRHGAGDARARQAMYTYRRIHTKRYFKLVKLLGPLFDTQRIPHTDDLFFGVRRPLRGLKLWHSLPWAVLSQAAVDLVIAESVQPWSARYRHALLPEESYFPTAVARAGLRLRDSRVTFCRFSKGSYNADVLAAADLDEAYASGAPFARKFDDEVDSAVLDLLDRRLLGSAGVPRDASGA